MESKRFTKNDGGFICEHCGAAVQPLGYTSRNHCPRCLWSKHLDENPGDRLSDCGGQMEPLFSEPDPRRGFIITHRCTRCGALRRNKAARDDDMPLLIALTAKER